jgi:hypothetical protein
MLKSRDAVSDGQIDRCLPEAIPVGLISLPIYRIIPLQIRSGLLQPNAATFSRSRRLVSGSPPLRPRWRPENRLLDVRRKTEQVHDLHQSRPRAAVQAGECGGFPHFAGLDQPLESLRQREQLVRIRCVGDPRPLRSWLISRIAES